MSDVAKNMDSVFDAATKDDLDFDIMFDQDDSLIDLVNGFNEAGEPLTGVDFVDLHQTEDDATADDVRDVESDDNTMGAKDVEGTKEEKPEDNSLSQKDFDKESDADKTIGDAEKDYQDDKDNGTAPKDNGAASKDDDVTDVIDKVIECDNVAPKGAEGTKEAEVLDNTLTMADLEKESDADKFEGDADKDYQDDKDNGTAPKDDNVTDVIDKVTEEADDPEVDDEDFVDDDDDLLGEACGDTSEEDESFEDQEGIEEGFFHKVNKLDLSKFKKIKDAKPSEFADEKEVKEFIDKNYNKIEEITEELKKYEKDMTKSLSSNLAVSLIGMLISLPAACLAGPVGVAVAGTSLALVILSLISTFIDYSIASKNESAIKDTIKIKNALVKLNKSNKLSNEMKRKIESLIDKIDDSGLTLTNSNESFEDITLESIDKEIEDEFSLESIEYEIREEADVDEQDISSEIEDSIDKDVEEAATNEDDDDDDDILDMAINKEPAATGKYSYDPSDEDIIDDVINGNV